jgi:hypothetical protein
LPDPSAVVVAPPLKVRSAPLPALAGLTVPEMLHVVCDALNAGTWTFAPLTEIVWLTGVNETPDLAGVTTYVPFGALENE